VRNAYNYYRKRVRYGNECLYNVIGELNSGKKRVDSTKKKGGKKISTSQKKTGYRGVSTPILRKGTTKGLPPKKKGIRTLFNT